MPVRRRIGTTVVAGLLTALVACGAPAGPDSQTLVVALYYSMSAAGIRAQQSVDAMAVMYTAMMLVLLVVALRFVNPTQLVARVKEEPE
jgi:putative spermidine/putrescine transport system permease protein